MSGLIDLFEAQSRNHSTRPQHLPLSENPSTSTCRTREMTSIIVHSTHQQYDHHFDPALLVEESSPELSDHPSSPEEEPAHANEPSAEDAEHTAEFIAECERLGVPANVVAKIQRRNQRFEDKWWKDMQLAANDDGCIKKEDGENGHQVKMSSPSAEEIMVRRSMAKENIDISNVQTVPSPMPLTQDVVASAQQLLRQTKAEALDALRSTHGDTSNPRFVTALKSLSSLYRGMKNQPGATQDLSSNFEGTWTMLSRPNFRDGLGQNRRGDFVYTLGRMAFGMFRPTELRCSIQRIINSTTFVGPDDDLPDNVPRSLRQEIQDLRDAIRLSGTTDVATNGEGPILRTYDIEVEFCIEPKDEDDIIATSNGGRRLSTTSSVSSTSTSCHGEESYAAPSKPLRAKMITNGYLLPDPQEKDRLTVWFTGGTIMPIRETGEEDVEKSKKKKKKSKRSKSKGAEAEAGSSPSLSSIKESLCEECGNSCPLLLHECRRENKQCTLHGQKKLSREYRHKMKARCQKYVRPKTWGTYVPHTTGLSVGDMVDAPFSSEWEDIFAVESNWKKKTWGESAKLLAAKMLLGADVPDKMEDDGSMSYSLHRPIGGHGTTYVDVLYLDEDMRITKGNAGSIFVQVKESRSSSNTATSTATTRHAVQVQSVRTKKAVAA